jgi:peroxiredoxin
MRSVLTSRWILALVVVLLLGLGANAWLRKARAPDVTFTDLSGQKVALHALRGKVVVVNFWSTSCGPCIQEMPQLINTYNKYKKKDFEFIAIAVSSDAPNYVLDYAASRQLPFKVVLDINDTFAQAFGGVPWMPLTFIIGKDGKIIEHFDGQLDFPVLHRALDKALAA